MPLPIPARTTPKIIFSELITTSPFSYLSRGIPILSYRTFPLPPSLRVVFVTCLFQLSMLKPGIVFLGNWNLPNYGSRPTPPSHRHGRIGSTGVTWNQLAYRLSGRYNNSPNPLRYRTRQNWVLHNTLSIVNLSSQIPYSKPWTPSHGLTVTSFDLGAIPGYKPLRGGKGVVGGSS